MVSEFLTPLDKRDINDKEFALLSTLMYRSEILGGTITVPKGFVSDGASTPRVPIVYWLYGDRAHHGACVHDFLYRSPNHVVDVVREDTRVRCVVVTKKMADDIFVEAMKTHNKGWFVRTGMWFGVWIGGRKSYRTGPERYRIETV